MSVTRAGLRPTPSVSSPRQICLLPKFPHQERACEDTACRSVNHAALMTSWHSSDLKTQTEYYPLELPKGKPHTTFVWKETEFIKKLCAELSQAVRLTSSISTAQGSSSLWRTLATLDAQGGGSWSQEMGDAGIRCTRGSKTRPSLLVLTSLTLTPALGSPSPDCGLGESEVIPFRRAEGCWTQPQVTRTPLALDSHLK